MRKDELIYYVNNKNIQDLLPLTKVIDDEDVKKYSQQGYHVDTLEKFKKKFPQVSEADLEFVCYQKDMVFSELLYYAPEKLMFFSINTYLTDKGFIFMSPYMGMELSKTIFLMKTECEQKSRAGEYHHLYKMVPSAYVLEYISNTFHQIPKGVAYDIFIDFYSSEDFGSRNVSTETIQKLVGFKTAQQLKRTEKQLQRLSNEDVLHVYRGLGDKSNTNGFSFTLEEDIARLFAFQYSIDSEEVCIQSGDIKKSDIIEYINGREEKEILALPEKVYNKVSKKYIGLYSLPEVDDLIFEEYKKQKGRFQDFCRTEGINLENGDHDCQHLMRVLFLSILLAKHYGLKKSVRHSLYNAAMFHDIDWYDGGINEKHGLSGYEVVARGEKALAKDSLMRNLMVYHCIDDKKSVGVFPSGQPELAFNILKDADALDRQRFGLKDLKSEFLRLPYSRDLIFAAFQMTKMEF